MRKIMLKMYCHNLVEDKCIIYKIRPADTADWNIINENEWQTLNDPSDTSGSLEVHTKEIIKDLTSSNKFNV